MGQVSWPDELGSSLLERGLHLEWIERVLRLARESGVEFSAGQPGWHEHLESAVEAAGDDTTRTAAALLFANALRFHQRLAEAVEVCDRVAVRLDDCDTDGRTQWIMTRRLPPVRQRGFTACIPRKLHDHGFRPDRYRRTHTRRSRPRARTSTAGVRGPIRPRRRSAPGPAIMGDAVPCRLRERELGTVAVRDRVHRPLHVRVHTGSGLVGHGGV